MTLPLSRAFEKRAPGPICALRPFLERLGKKQFLKRIPLSLLICFRYEERQNNCPVWNVFLIEDTKEFMPPKKFRNVRETGRWTEKKTDLELNIIMTLRFVSYCVHATECPLNSHQKQNPSWIVVNEGGALWVDLIMHAIVLDMNAGNGLCFEICSCCQLERLILGERICPTHAWCRVKKTKELRGH